MKFRTFGPSFSRKKVLKTAKVRKKMADVRPWIPFANPWSSVEPACATPVFASSVGCEVFSMPASLEPALHLGGGLRRGRLDLCGLVVEAAEDEQADHHPERDQCEQDDGSACRAWNPTALHLRDQRPRDRRQDRAHDHRVDDVDVSPSSQTSPKRTRPTPTRNQASRPRSRSHMRSGEHA